MAELELYDVQSAREDISYIEDKRPKFIKQP
jgi:hypothetical protein